MMYAGIGKKLKMKLSENGKKLIKKFEGCSLKAYKCPAGVLTIGYGHTKGVVCNQKITQAEADRLFNEDVKIFENAVNTLVKVPINQNQFDALVSFTFNLGIGAFKNSTLLRLLNQGLYCGASEQFGLWVHVGKIVLHGLVVRREEERKLFLTKN